MSNELKLRNYASYEDMVNCPAWQKGLEDLNSHLLAALNSAGVEPVLNGNLLYGHKVLGFEKGGMLPAFEGKRRNLFALAKSVRHMLEVGVNGGHSLFVALSANPELRVTGVDICQQVVPSWARVDIYVPAAFDWLNQAFPGRCSFITGNSLVELPRYAIENPDEVVDLLHLDGAKDTHLREFLAIKPLMRKGSFVIHDDINTKPVRISMRQMLKLNMIEKPKLEEFGVAHAQGHRVTRVL